MNVTQVRSNPALRAEHLFQEHRDAIFRRTDRLFAVLMVLQWLAGIAAARWLTPLSWEGSQSRVHIHVWAAVLLGGAIIALPVALAILRPGSTFTRHSIAVGQMLTSALLIHLTGGRIETHFHVFGSLAFLAFYRDWRVFVSASVVVAFDHWFRGAFWPQSVYGIAVAHPWRWLEHAGWVVFEDIFLAISCVQGVAEMRDIASRRAQLEAANQTVEAQVFERTTELRGSEERFRSLSAASPIGIFKTDAEGRCTYTNARWQEIFGISEAESHGEGWIRGVHPEDRARLMEEWTDAVERSMDYAREFRVLRGRDVVWVHARAAVVKGPNGFPSGYVGTVEDITERKRSESSLREKTDALENAVEGISRLDPEGRYVAMNSSYATMLGYQPDELVGTPWEPTVHAEDQERARGAYRQMLSGGRAEIDVRGIRKDRSVFHKRVSMVKAFDEQRQFIGHYCFTKDITEHKNLEEQLRQSQKIEAIGRLAGGVAHDFNNLLTVILGGCHMLSRNLPADERLRSDLDEIKGAGDRAASLTRQLLAFSRKQVLVPTVLDLNQLVGGMDKMLRRMIGEDIDLLSVPASDLGKVRADAGQIEQVIMNLAINARDAMPSGGKLTIETKSVTLDSDYATGHPSVEPGEYVLLAVSDSGIGMDAETQARIFEPFFTTKERGQGTGLGLAMVYGIVKQSGGHVQVYSQVGRGTTFRIYLPRLKGVPSSADASPLVPPPSKGHETVLLVEDEKGVRKLARRGLEASGYRVLEATDAASAMTTLREHPGSVDMLLTDVVMPGIGGPELVRRIRADRPDLKVLFMSGYTDNAIIHQGVLDPGAEFIQKPFNIDVLLRRVRDILDTSLELTSA